MTDQKADYKVSKRPLLRPSIPSKYASSSTTKVIYISTKTPFMAAVKRVQKMLDVVDKREAQSALDTARRKDGRKNRGGDGRVTNHELDDAARIMAAKSKEKGKEGEVVMKGTGKAIEKTLGLGLFFQQRDEYTIKIQTSSVGAIDDIVESESRKDDNESEHPTSEGVKDTDNSTAAVEEGANVEMPPSRIRYASVVEVFVSRS